MLIEGSEEATYIWDQEPNTKNSNYRNSTADEKDNLLTLELIVKANKALT